MPALLHVLLPGLTSAAFAQEEDLSALLLLQEELALLARWQEEDAVALQQAEMAQDKAQIARISARMRARAERMAALEAQLAPLEAAESEPPTEAGGFAFHGYFRTGAGWSADGASQPLFRAPGARGHYTLGNQPDTNVELHFYHEALLEPPSASSALRTQAVVSISGFAFHGSDLSLGSLAQCFGYLGRADGTGALWAGRRFYDRKSILINDHYWLNSGQGAHGGLGFESVPVGPGRLSVALFRLEEQGVAVPGSEGEAGLVNSTTVDVRWAGLPLSPGAAATVWLLGARTHASEALAVDAASGIGGGGWIDLALPGGGLTVAAIHQRGAAIPQSDFSPNPIRADLGYTLSEATVTEANLSGGASLDDKTALAAAAAARWEGHTSDSGLRWLSAGIRPSHYLIGSLRGELDLGVDHVKLDQGPAGALVKGAAALKLTAESFPGSAPGVRIFAAAAKWSPELVGYIGGFPGTSPYAEDAFGWSAGLQGEAWW